MPVLDMDQVIETSTLFVLEDDIREDQGTALKLDQGRAGRLGLWQPGRRFGVSQGIDTNLQPEPAR